MELQRKIDQSLKLLDSAQKAIGNEAFELCYSGGKDSDVILHLARKAGINIVPIYKCTTIDPIGTIKHCVENGVKIVQPKRTFFEIIRKKGFPSRFARFCCSELKEYKIMDNAILGIRKSESIKRNERYQEPTNCRVYGKNKKVHQIFPILYWDNEDMRKYIEREHIQCHPLYYDENGNFDITKRLGCVGCPLKSDKGVGDFLQNPKMLKLWIKNGDIYFKTHPHYKTMKRFKNVYNLMAFHLFFDNAADFEMASHTIFGNESWKKRLEDYFHIDL